MADESFDFIATTKVLLGIDVDEYDSILQLYVDLTIQAILNYCNIFELPSALNYVVCQIAADEYRHNKGINSIGEVVGNVTKIEEDGRIVDFGDSKSYINSSINNRLSSVTQLRRYKKLYRVTPEENSSE